MGKISDALDKIDTLNELGRSDSLTEEAPASAPFRDTPPSTSPPPPAKRKEKSPPSTIQGNGKWDARLFKAINNDRVIPEVFKTLRAKILYPVDGRPVPKTIMVASSLPKEGKSFVTANIGVSFASGMDQHCLLVDCDLRHPKLAEMFGIKSNFGLNDYLRDDIDLTKLIVKTSIQKLSVLPGGQIPPNPAELISSVRMRNLMQEVAGRYDDRIVLFDSPPMLLAAESIVLSGYVDAVILVIRRGRAKRDEVSKFIDSVGEDKILGIVFNDHKENHLDKAIMPGYGYY